MRAIETVEKSEIVFGLVDSLGRVDWGGPSEPRTRRCLCPSGKLGEIGHHPHALSLRESPAAQTRGLKTALTVMPR
jgi:hypothetical protein